MSYLALGVWNLYPGSAQPEVMGDVYIAAATAAVLGVEGKTCNTERLSFQGLSSEKSKLNLIQHWPHSSSCPNGGAGGGS